MTILGGLNGHSRRTLMSGIVLLTILGPTATATAATSPGPDSYDGGFSYRVVQPDLIYPRAKVEGISPVNGWIELRNKDQVDAQYSNVELIAGKSFLLLGPEQQLGETIPMVAIVHPAAPSDDGATPIEPGLLEVFDSTLS